MIVQDPTAQRFTKRDWREKRNPMSAQRRAVRIDHKQHKRIAKKLLAHAIENEGTTIEFALFKGAAEFIKLANSAKFTRHNFWDDNGTLGGDHHDAMTLVIKSMFVPRSILNFQAAPWIEESELEQADVNTLIDELLAWKGASVEKSIGDHFDSSGDGHMIAGTWFDKDEWARHRTAMNIAIDEIWNIIQEAGIDCERLGFLPRGNQW